MSFTSNISRSTFISPIKSKASFSVEESVASLPPFASLTTTMSGVADAEPESFLSFFLQPVREKTSEQTSKQDKILLNI